MCERKMVRPGVHEISPVYLWGSLRWKRLEEEVCFKSRVMSLYGRDCSVCVICNQDDQSELDGPESTSCDHVTNQPQHCGLDVMERLLIDNQQYATVTD